MQPLDDAPPRAALTEVASLAPQTARRTQTQGSMTPCQNASKDCAGSAARQACFFVQALDAVESGVLIGSRSEGKYVYANAYAQRLLAEMPESLSLHRLLSSDPTGFGDPCDQSAAIESATRMVVKDGGRAIGLCLYQRRTQIDLVIIQP